MSRYWRLLSLAVPVLLLWTPLRQAVEASMLRHMLGVFPLLLAAGWCCAGAVGAHGRSVIARWNGLGFPGLLLVTVVLTVWMIPNALDMATAHLSVDAAKTASVFAAGVVLASSVRQASLVIQMFFIGNWVTMTIFAGVLFQALPSRLCNAYLVSDQVHTGQGMVLLAIVVGAVWGYSAWRQRQQSVGVSQRNRLA